MAVAKRSKISSTRAAWPERDGALRFLATLAVANISDFPRSMSAL
jgi:hypothetical protein